jgi:alpha-L-rhamnosidase
MARHFWDEERGLFADDLGRVHFSEHTQCLALLSGRVDETRRARIAHGLLADPELTRTTIYFSHYLFETYGLLGRADALFERLQLWFDLPEQGFTTTPEQPEPSRSDCHGWGAHPLFHDFATLLGVRPVGPGFAEVEITPLLGPLKELTGSLVHPRGQIDVQLRVQGGRLTGSISLPEGIVGTLRYMDVSQPLGSRLQQIDLK